jgi:hypothetical protein
VHFNPPGDRQPQVGWEQEDSGHPRTHFLTHFFKTFNKKLKKFIINKNSQTK